MPLGQKLIKRAMRLSLLLESGETPSTEELTDGLEALNGLLGAWSALAWIIPYRTTDDALAVPSSANSYTIGSGGAFNTTRPIRIDTITITSGGVPYVLKEKPLEMYRALKLDQERIPEFFAYEPSYPTGTLYFPTKLSTSQTITIDSLKPFTAFADYDTTNYDLPPGYEDAIVFTLAKRFGAEFGVSPSLAVQEGAAQGENFLLTQSNLHRMGRLSIDGALTGKGRVYNVVADQ